MPLVNIKSSFGGNRGRRIGKHPAITNVNMFSMGTFDAELDLPIVYCDRYNIKMFGLELLHTFDTKKYSKLARCLNYQFLDTLYARIPHDAETSDNFVDLFEAPMSRCLRYLQPNRPINMVELRNHHSPDYILQVHEDKELLSKITELYLIKWIPNCCLDTRLLDPIKWQISGTIYAANLAMQHGWAINLGGGFHQASYDSGSNFCLFSDVMLAIKYIWRRHPLQRVMIIDLDAHQALGIEHDLAKMSDKHREMIFILDIFNNTLQPADTEADTATNLRIELESFTGDDVYLKRLDEALSVAFNKFKPSIVFYIAGQDVLKDDPVGWLDLTDGGLIRRDELVFKYSTELYKCPIVMLLGGGFQTRGVQVQAESIRRLFARNLIWGGNRAGSRSLTRPMQATDLALQQSGPNTIKITPSTSESATISLATAIKTPDNKDTKMIAVKSSPHKVSSPSGRIVAKVSQTATKASDDTSSLNTIGTLPVMSPLQTQASQGFTLLVNKTLNDPIKRGTGLEHPVDAISESVSTSGGIHRIRKVIRVAPKSAHVSKLLPMLSKSAKLLTRMKSTEELAKKLISISKTTSPKINQ